MQDVFLQSIVFSAKPGGAGVVAHTAVFANDPTVTPVTDLVQDISKQIGSQLSNVPLGSSSGGFTYRYDASLGTVKRTTQSFGPAFAERAVTAGKGKFSFGMNYQHSHYSSLDGKDLEGGDIAIFLPHQIIGSYVEGDMVEADLKMNLNSDAFVFFGNFGVANKLDVGVVVPVEHVSMDLTYHAVIRDFATHASSPTTHVFSNNQKTEDITAQGSASGIGDLRLRAKYVFTEKEARGLGLGVDLRLPTGDEANMLGTGATQAEFFLIASGVNGKLGHHGNAGFTVSSDRDLASNQVNYVGGVDYAATPRLTLVGDLLGRTFLDSKRLKDASLVHVFRDGSDVAPFQSISLSTVALESGSFTSLLGTAGLKFNAAENMLLSAHVVVSLNESGLRRGVTGVFGVDYTF
jgi:hypothetical protein